MIKYIIGFLIAIIVVLLFNYHNIYQKEYEKYLFGYWIADEGYCEDAGAREMMLFVGDARKSAYNPFAKTERTAHLIINDDITNQMINIRYKPTSTGYSSSLKPYTIDAEIKFEEECIIPANVTIEVDIHRGTLKIYNSGIIYGLFHKVHDVTNIFDKHPESSAKKTSEMDECGDNIPADAQSE